MTVKEGNWMDTDVITHIKACIPIVELCFDNNIKKELEFVKRLARDHERKFSIESGKLEFYYTTIFLHGYCARQKEEQLRDNNE